MAEKDQDVCDCELLESPPVVITQHCLLLLYVMYIYGLHEHLQQFLRNTCCALLASYVFSKKKKQRQVKKWTTPFPMALLSHLAFVVNLPTLLYAYYICTAAHACMAPANSLVGNI